MVRRRKSGYLQTAPLPEITEARDDRENILLGVERVSFDKRGNARILAAGIFNGEKVGLEAVVKGGMRPGIIGGDIDRIDDRALYLAGVVFGSCGRRSDKLLIGLSKLYGVPLRSRKMRKRVVFDSFSLAGDPRKVKVQEIVFKLFHGIPPDDDEPLGDYCELYFHVDLPKGLLRINERDDDFRPGIIAAFAAR